MFRLRKDVCVLVAFWLIILLGDVATVRHVQAAAATISAAEHQEFAEDLAPISVLPSARQPREEGVREWLAEYLAQLGGGRFHAVRGTVIGLTAIERHFPEELHAEAGIGTYVEIAVPSHIADPATTWSPPPTLAGNCPTAAVSSPR